MAEELETPIRHVAIIMDGNGRWAERRGLSRIEGHREGLEAVREVVRAAGDLGIEVLTLYAFSLENWNRPQAEVAELMRLLEHYLEVELPEVVRNDIEVRAIGRLDRLPPSVRRRVDEAIQKSRGGRAMRLVFALSYGGRAEIVDAARKLVRDAERGSVDPEAIDEKTFAAYLYDPELPDPDLLIRTGAESRVSNFLLWQIAYTELFTTDVMWPDFRAEHLRLALRDYRARERRFGLTSAQVRGGGHTP
ncbi:MAG TPA: isoprenyl transferase [Myxococcota bacterium]|jgi:undecaprenyl diphosphate synthase|nr:isoprenyl transferase [Myxococcota bacterium]